MARTLYPNVSEDDIAVIGIGTRFPGEATSPARLWKVLQEKKSEWSEFPKDRLNIDGYYHPGGDRQGSVSQDPLRPALSSC